MKNKRVKLGGLLIAAALCLSGYNLWDAHRAEQSAEQIVQQLDLASADEQGERQLSRGFDSAMEMPVVELGGNKYIGILSIPSLRLILPVMSEWSDSKLRLAPCRYFGSAYSNDMIIAAHNYPAHFGMLKHLENGDEICFSDTAGNEFFYTVSETERLASSSLDEMKSGDWDLTLFTCTDAGKARMTIRCERRENDAVI